MNAGEKCNYYLKKVIYLVKSLQCDAVYHNSCFMGGSCGDNQIAWNKPTSDEIKNSVILQKVSYTDDEKLEVQNLLFEINILRLILNAAKIKYEILQVNNKLMEKNI